MTARADVIRPSPGPAARPKPRKPARQTFGTLAALYVFALGVNLLSVAAVASSQVLMGEEMSVSIRDVLFSVEQRAQASIWSTNFGAPVYYWLASHLDPDYSLFSARYWKAAAMALLAPLAYLIATRRLGCGRPAGLLAGTTTVLLPGVAMFGWLATDNGLETLVGAAGLYLATSSRVWWLLAPIAGGLAVTTYPAGIAWALGILAVSSRRALRSDYREDGVAVALASVLGLAVILFPLYWWQDGPRRIVTGGATADGDLLGNLANLVHQLAVDGESYYFFAQLPALGSGALAAVVVAAAVMAAGLRWRRVAPWLLVAAFTVLLWLGMGNMPGVRRAIALSLVAALVLAVAVDLLVQLLPGRRHVAVGIAGLLVCVPLLAALLQWQVGYWSGAARLVADFPVAPGPMPPTFAALDADLRSGRLTAEQIVTEQDGIRTLAVVWMLADRTGRGTDGLPAPDEIVAVCLQR